MKAEKQMNSILPTASSAGPWGFFAEYLGIPNWLSSMQEDVLMADLWCDLPDNEFTLGLTSGSGNSHFPKFPSPFLSSRKCWVLSQVCFRVGLLLKCFLSPSAVRLPFVFFSPLLICIQWATSSCSVLVFSKDKWFGKWNSPSSE